MALGKVRSSRRSSSSSGSYKSTITTLVFVALCIVGVWMLTSSSVVSTQRSTTSRSSSSSYVSKNPVTVKPTKHHKDDSHSFDDTPGDLPDDAIKGDHSSSTTSSTSTTESNVLKQPVEEGDKSNLLDRSQDPETTATAEQENVNDEQEKVTSFSNTEIKSQNEESIRHEKEQEEHDNQVTEESNHAEDNNAQTKVDTEDQSHQEQSSDVTSHETESEIQSRDEQQHDQHETEAENVHQTQEDTNESHTHLETDNENAEQIQQDTQLESSEDTPKIEVESNEKQDTENENNEKLQETQKEQEADDHHSYQPTEETGVELNQDSQQVEDTRSDEKQNESNYNESALDGAQSGIPKESKESKEAWSTQAHQSENQKERKTTDGITKEYTWELCNVTAGADYIPCLDNEEALKHIHNTGHYEHRERHCPREGPNCLVPIPEGYKKSMEWPTSREKIWYHNVPHTKLAEVKGHQNWVKVTGEFLTFPGGGTQFIHGALHYIDFLQKAQPKISWGKHTRVILDVGCGVASFGGYLFERDVLTMSFAPKDEHEAQVQFALERGIPAISAVMGTQRLPFPGKVFDLVHCARCRVPWHKEGGTLLLELNRVLRPGGFFVWSATPVYQKLAEDVEIWREMKSLTASMCWELVTIQKDKLNSVGAAIYRKPTSNECYSQRKHNRPPMCKNDDDPNAAWYVPLQACMHRIPVDDMERGSRWPETWPNRVHKPPYWLNNSQKGIYGKPAPEDFVADYEHWRQVVTKTYMSELQISWSNVRNAMDMRAVYGGFAAALKDLKVWVMNVVGVNGPDTLPIIYERGLFGIYHDWCESFSTYPRTYDLLHADHLFSSLKKRCNLLPVIVEVDRIVRPGGKFIARDDPEIIGEIENILKSLHWEIHLTFSKDDEGILSAEKTNWRPGSSLSSS
ncbi:S-adenosyl-l-methionine-dependent methyltransferases superfamily protein [Thalictrum thalictroides]|uniref:S-adenosyl-l-methionine-dependent methyltransferases superfamily protein n=1 Tax=Thalictrum thalictroides TaxID=46969 RepID=A0A7J6VBW4_THATH|nr:S-adenosyl-l-methionine-dependent methyltransferases superfamily protein [Thalictrum thalictroides]